MLTYDRFEGYSEVNEPSKLAPGTLVKGSKNIDLTRRLGALMKRYGIEAQIPSLGAGGVKGLHTYRRTSGDRVVFGHGTSLYRLTGQNSSLVKTSDADFNAGTHNNTESASGTLQPTLSNTEKPGIEVLQGAGSIFLPGTGGTIGQTFIPQQENVSAIEVYIQGLTSSATVTVYNSPSKTTTLGSGSANGNGGTQWLKIPLNVTVTAGQSYYFEVVFGGSVTVFLSATNYPDGQRHAGGSPQADDLAFKTHYKDYNNGDWTSPIYDLGSTPASSSLSWTQAGSTLTLKVRGSSDSQNWGDWQAVSNGGGIPLTRFIQVKPEFVSSAGKCAKVQDFTVNYETAFTQATAIRTGLAGNVIRYCDWKDQMYFTDGGRPQRYGATRTLNVNGTFETDLLGWGTVGNHSIIRTTADKNSGVASMEIVSTGPSGGESLVFCSNADITQGRLYTITFMAKSVSGNNILRVILDGGGGSTLFTLTTSWQAYSISGLANNVGAVYFWLNGAGTCRIDDVVITTETTNLGVDPPTTAPTLATSGTGLTGTYRCVVTYVNDIGAESNAGPSAQITLSNQGIAWSNIPVGPAGTTKRNLYRTKANGSLYFYVGTLDNNTTITYTDTTIDANLVIPMETDNDIPPNASIIYEHKNYMMYITGDRLYFSKLNKPDNVPPTAYRSFPGNILAVREYQDALIVSGDQFVTAVIGDIWDKDPNIDTTYTRAISEGFGSLSHEATVKAYSPEGDILVFPTRLGLSYITPGLQENSVKSIPMSYDVQPIFDGAVNKGNMSAIYSNNCLYLALNYYGTDTPIQTNNIILVLDLRTSKWCPPWTIASAGFCIANGKVYFGSPTVGQIFELNKGTSDNGSSIHAVAKLRVDQFTGKKRTKFKRIRLALTENSDVTSLVIKANVDGVDNIIPANVLKTPNITDRFRLQEKKGYQYQVTLEDNSTRDWGVTEIATEAK